MKNIRGNLFQQTQADAICITTNGFVKRNGENVMGRGCANEACKYIHGLPKLVGNALRKYGNITQVVDSSNNRDMVIFPVKPEVLGYLSDKSEVVKHMQDKFSIGSQVPGWACVADINIITKSAERLVQLADAHGWDDVVLPRPGCGAGELQWKNVEPVLEDILDDRFSVITF